MNKLGKNVKRNYVVHEAEIEFLNLFARVNGTSYATVLLNFAL